MAEKTKQAKDKKSSDEKVEKAPKEEVAEAVVTEEKTTKEEVKKTDKAPKKRRSLFKNIMLLIGFMIIGGILWMGWLGFVPVLSNILGAHNARDLGISFDEADLSSFYDKTSQTVLDFADALEDRPGHKVIFADPVRMTANLTDEEITARIDDLSDWVFMPLTNVQVRFNDDNGIEVSGNLLTDVVDEFVNFIGGVGYSQEDVQTGLDWVGRFAGDPAIYINSTGTIQDNVLSLDVTDVKIGRWTPPMDEANKVLFTGTVNALAGTVGLDVESATFTDGMMHFMGTGPTTIYVRTK